MSDYTRVCMQCRHFDPVNPYTGLTYWCYKHKRRQNPVGQCSDFGQATSTFVILWDEVPMVVIGNSTRRPF